MVDVGFLLLTFFMLTAKFKSQTDEALDIHLPSALADTTKLPDVNIAMVTIGVESNVANPDTVILYGIANEKERATIYGSVKPTNPKTGQPYTAAELEQKSQIRVDKKSLETVVQQSRLNNSTMRYAIDADKRVTYGYVDDVMRILQRNGATRFNLVTVTKSDEKS